MKVSWGLFTAALMLVPALPRAQVRSGEGQPDRKVPTIESATPAAAKPPAEDAPKPGTLISSPFTDQEKVADEGGQIYVTRGYKGVVPGVRDASSVPSKANPEAAARPAVVEWVGFQPFATYSRVFIQVDGRFGFTASKPKPDEIEVRIPDAVVATRNDLFDLPTGSFPTAVSLVSSVVDASGVVVHIHLKRPTGYLYRSEGRYIFVDIEM